MELSSCYHSYVGIFFLLLSLLGLPHISTVSCNHLPVTQVLTRSWAFLVHTGEQSCLWIFSNALVRVIQIPVVCMFSFVSFLVYGTISDPFHKRFFWKCWTFKLQCISSNVLQCLWSLSALMSESCWSNKFQSKQHYETFFFVSIS